MFLIFYLIQTAWTYSIFRERHFIIKFCGILVVGSFHATHAAEHVPTFWVIISVEQRTDGNLDYYVVRDASDNPKVRADHKITILWRPDLKNLFERNKLPKYKKKSKNFVQQKLIEKVWPKKLWPQVYEELFERDYTIFDQ